MPPTFAWGNRVGNAPPNPPFPGYFNVNDTQDFVDQPDQGRGPSHAQDRVLQHAQLQGRAGAGTDSFGTINFAQDAVGTNPFDTSFGFANAAIGIVLLVQQASKYVEGNYVYNNTEGYMQDNWKVNSRLTLDYGVRFVQSAAAVRPARQASNFLPDPMVDWPAAPVLYRPGCAVTVARNCVSRGATGRH